jgi:hypothetical protein
MGRNNPVYYIPDEERHPLGLGWEFHRRGKRITDNPFPEGSQAWKDFQQGFNEFAEPGSRFKSLS